MNIYFYLIWMKNASWEILAMGDFTDGTILLT